MTLRSLEISRVRITTPFCHTSIPRKPGPERTCGAQKIQEGNSRTPPRTPETLRYEFGNMTYRLVEIRTVRITSPYSHSSIPREATCDIPSGAPFSIRGTPGTLPWTLKTSSYDFGSMIYWLVEIRAVRIASPYSHSSIHRESRA